MPTQRRSRGKQRTSARKVRRPTQAATAAIVVRKPGPKPWLIQPEELTILKNAVCKKATDVELQFCLTVARRYKLDPFKRQIWFVPRKDSGADDGEGGSGAKVWIPVVGIDGLCHVAARDHKDYGSFSEVTFGPLIAVNWQNKGQGATHTLQAPEWARVEAWKKGAGQPTIGMVWWKEIYPNINYAPLVRRMPRLMLGKCAKAQAVRMAYPETGGLYIEDEMQEMEPDNLTPAGREIVPAQPKDDPLAAYKAREAAAVAALPDGVRERVQAKMAEEEAKKAPPAPRTIDVQPVPQIMTYRQLNPKVWTVEGPDDLLHKHREFLRQFYNEKAGQLQCTAQGLFKIMSEMEKRGVLVQPADPRQPGED